MACLVRRVPGWPAVVESWNREITPVEARCLPEQQVGRVVRTNSGRCKRGSVLLPNVGDKVGG